MVLIRKERRITESLILIHQTVLKSCNVCLRFRGQLDNFKENVDTLSSFHGNKFDPLIGRIHFLHFYSQSRVELGNPAKTFEDYIFSKPKFNYVEIFAKNKTQSTIYTTELKALTSSDFTGSMYISIQSLLNATRNRSPHNLDPLSIDGSRFDLRMRTFIIIFPFIRRREFMTAWYCVNVALHIAK